MGREGIISVKREVEVIFYSEPLPAPSLERRGGPKSPLIRGVADPSEILLGKAGVCRYFAVRVNPDSH